jgi:hypothetical protein
MILLETVPRPVAHSGRKKVAQIKREFTAGIPGRLRHDFRRTAVRNMERAGVPRSVATKLTGHKTESVYRRYAIVSDTDLREAARRLGGITGGR